VPDEGDPARSSDANGKTTPALVSGVIILWVLVVIGMFVMLLVF
jgi:hypothetical protein